MTKCEPSKYIGDPHSDNGRSKQNRCVLPCYMMTKVQSLLNLGVAAGLMVTISFLRSLLRSRGRGSQTKVMVIAS